MNDYVIPDEWYEKYLGGRGLSARIILEEMPQGADPLGPENVLIFGTGPLQGTMAPGAGRNVVMAKSPKTRGVSGSYVGGFFPYELGTSGYDGVIVRGEADHPKYLTISDGDPQLLEARDLWGMEVADVDEELKDRHGGGRVCTIGIAGEKLVKSACIMNDRNRAAGRPGFGAVMGSKNLKAILIDGHRRRPMEDEEKFDEVRKSMIKKLSPIIDWGKFGTTGALGGLNQLGALPTKNFQEGVYDEYEKITGETMSEEILIERDNCTACPVRCKRVVKTEAIEEEVEERYGGPEYETLASFGSLCMNDDLDVIALANQKCNAYGLDTISAGVMIAFAMEASEKGLIEENIEWGNGEDIVDLIEKISRRKGIGDKLAQGIDAISDEIGAEFDMQVKGQEIPMHEPRGKASLSLSYAVSPRGANHMETLHDSVGKHPSEMKEYFDGPVDRTDLNTKPKYCYHYENLVSFTNSVIYCAFHGWVGYFSDETWTYPEIGGLIEGVTGMELDLGDMLTIGERNFNLLKILADREGLKRGDDRLPKRFSESLPRGGSSQLSIPEEKLQKLIDEYYEIRGWNERGPTEKKLQELDMGNVLSYVDR